MRRSRPATGPEVQGVGPNVATATRTVVILVFAWAIALAGAGREALA